MPLRYLAHGDYLVLLESFTSGDVRRLADAAAGSERLTQALLAPRLAGDDLPTAAALLLSELIHLKPLADLGEELAPYNNQMAAMALVEFVGRNGFR